MRFNSHSRPLDINSIIITDHGTLHDLLLQCDHIRADHTGQWNKQQQAAAAKLESALIAFAYWCQTT